MRKLNTEEINKRLASYNIELTSDYNKLNATYNLTCTKNSTHKPFERNLLNLFDNIRLRPNYIPCPECRVIARIRFIEEKCPNLKVIDFQRQTTATSHFYKIMWCCKHCGHTFSRTDDEVLRGSYNGCNDCPQCGYDRRKRLYNKVFDSFDVYREQLNSDTKWVNKNYAHFLNSDLEHIDHKCSALECYTHCIPVWMCCSPVNLELISAAENLSKNRKSTMTIEQLVLEFSKWVLEHPEYTKLIGKKDEA